MFGIKQIHRYVFREHIFPFIGALFVFSFIFLVQYLISQIDKLVGKDLGVMVISEFMILSLAPIFAEVVPVAVFIAVLMAFGRFGEDNEITAWRASGINFSKILSAALVFAAIITAAMLFYNNNILPDANHKYKLLRQDIAYKHPDINFDAGYFLDDIPDYRILIRRKQDDMLYDILVYHDTRDVQETIWAKRGKLEIIGNKVILDLEDGEYHEFLQDGSEEYRRSRFKKYRITVSVRNLELRRRDSKYRSDREMSIIDMVKKLDEYRDLYAKSHGNILKNMAGAGLDTAGVDPRAGLRIFDESVQALEDSSAAASLSNEDKRALRTRLQELENARQRVRSFRDMARRYQQAESKYLVEIHKKVAMPFAAIIFVLIGAPLGMIVRRGGLGTSGGISLVFFLIYWGILMTGERLADRLLMAPWLAMWGANIIFGLLGLILVHFAIRERISLHMPEWVMNLVNAFKREK
ncbi:MAG: LptF/LptG family permease [Candidatus Marinimicrobia bacterium]|nr:LptF/LptG family permease [Candidatus Neomarinimicrobiota bacterium]